MKVMRIIEPKIGDLRIETRWAACKYASTYQYVVLLKFTAKKTPRRKGEYINGYWKKISSGYGHRKFGSLHLPSLEKTIEYFGIKPYELNQPEWGQYGVKPREIDMKNQPFSD